MFGLFGEIGCNDECLCARVKGRKEKRGGRRQRVQPASGRAAPAKRRARAETRRLLKFIQY